jgi:hypothetical protein
MVLIEDYRIKAEEINEFEPLQDINISDEISDKNPVEMTITVSYMSGGGEESAYAMNDILTFKLNQEEIYDIELEQNIDCIALENIRLTDEGIKEFISIADEFFGQVISTDDFVLSDDLED